MEVCYEIDGLGRIVISKALRRITGIDKETPKEIFIDKDMIVLRKFESSASCMITGENAI